MNFKIFIVCCIILFLTSCFHNRNLDTSGSLIKISETENDSYFLVVGFAILKINDKKNETVTIVDSNCIGFYLDTLTQFETGVGFQNSSSILIDKQENTIIEINKSFFKNTEIKVEQKGK